MGETPSDGETESISVLIKNETGKKTLFKIISSNESEEPHPLYALENVIKDHEGLLLGSGIEKGRLYKAALSGAGHDELRKIISCFDYVEVLPGTQYEAVNKEIIEISDELNIPVVAISDARYVDQLGLQALKIMRHWNHESEDFPDNHFWSTKEMLGAFSYLSEEKAVEIVIDNTHRIAAMCETVTICPKEKNYPLIAAAEQKLRNLCYENLDAKYANEKDKAEKRLEAELDSLAKTGMASYVLQMNELLKKSSLKAQNISLRGTAAGSMVTYLLGISRLIQ